MTDDKRQQFRFILEGFVRDHEFRLFNFRAVVTQPAEQRGERTPCTVRTDLSLLRRYGIQVQELPLLCRELLERRAALEIERDLTFTEEDMRVHQAGRIAVETTTKKTYRKPPPEGTRNGWRGPNSLNTAGQLR